MFGRSISVGMLSFLTDGEMGENNMGDMVTCCDDVNQHHDDELYFIIGHKNNTVELFGCPSEAGLMALSIHFGIFLLTSPNITLKGTIQNPKELPYSIEDGQQVFVVFADHAMRTWYGMRWATEYIEHCLTNYSASDINDFAVIVGKKFLFDTQRWDNITTGGVMAHGCC